MWCLYAWLFACAQLQKKSILNSKILIITICLSVSEFFIAAKNVDIMIHEATMEDDLIKDAEQKNHR